MKAISQALHSIVSEDLQHGFFLHAQPPQENQLHSQTLLNITLLRPLCTRGRDAEVSDSVDQEFLRGASETLLSLCNGDWGAPRVEHYCHEVGCCENHNPRVTADRMTSLIMQLLFDKVRDKLPSQTRWYTFPRHLELQSFGTVCHRLLARVLVRAFEQLEFADENGADDGDEVAAWHIHTGRKVRQCLECVQDTTNVLVIVASQ